MPKTMTALDFILVGPEIFLLASTCLILIADLFITDRYRQLSYFASLLALGVTAVLVAMLPAEHYRTFHGMFVSDGVAKLLKLVTCGTVAAVFL